MKGGKESMIFKVIHFMWSVAAAAVLTLSLIFICALLFGYCLMSATPVKDPGAAPHGKISKPLYPKKSVSKKIQRKVGDKHENRAKQGDSGYVHRGNQDARY